MKIQSVMDPLILVVVKKPPLLVAMVVVVDSMISVPWCVHRNVSLEGDVVDVVLVIDVERMIAYDDGRDQ